MGLRGWFGSSREERLPHGALQGVLHGGPFDTIVVEITPGQTSIELREPLAWFGPSDPPPPFPATVYRYTGKLDSEGQAIFAPDD